MLVLVSGQLRLEVLVDDEVNDGLADAPVGRGHASPEAADSLERENGTIKNKDTSVMKANQIEQLFCQICEYYVSS